MKLRNSIQRRIFKKRTARNVQKLKNKHAEQGRKGAIGA